MPHRISPSISPPSISQPLHLTACCFLLARLLWWTQTPVRCNQPNGNTERQRHICTNRFRAERDDSPSVGNSPLLSGQKHLLLSGRNSSRARWGHALVPSRGESSCAGVDLYRVGVKRETNLVAQFRGDAHRLLTLLATKLHTRAPRASTLHALIELQLLKQQQLQQQLQKRQQLRKRQHAHRQSAHPKRTRIG